MWVAGGPQEGDVHRGSCRREAVEGGDPPECLGRCELVSLQVVLETPVH